jgi:predicted metal-binding membrane protein
MRALQRGVRPALANGLAPAAVPAAIVLAWVGLLLAELRGAPLSHDALAGGSVPLAAALPIFGVAWVAMVVAMMLPSGYPAVRAFAATIVGEGRDRMARLAPFLAGYVALWTLFGFVLFVGDLGIHGVLERLPASGAAHSTLTGDALLVAGAYQLTERKRRCLMRCRQAAEGHWAVGSASSGGVALRLGLAHGLDCVGSGWALMLAVFALGSPELVWMALFGAVMAYEKAGRHGVAAGRVAAAALLAASVLVALSWRP